MNSGYEQHLDLVKKRRLELKKCLRTLFPEPTKLTLEIGSGHGHWLVNFADKFADKRCLGLDIIGDRVERARRKASRAGLSNVDFLKGEAFEVLELLPEDVVIDEVFILFPDPWPKKRHWKKRLFCDAFLSKLSALCSRGALCHFRTDHAPYFDWAMEVVDNQQEWITRADVSWPFEHATVFQDRATTFHSLIIERL